MFSRLHNRKRGQSIVEWAIILPFLLLILISIVELAPLMNTLMKVEKAVQYGARVGAIHGKTNAEIRDGVLFNMQGMVNPGDLVGIGPYTSSQHDAKVYAYRETFQGSERTYIEIVPGEIDKRINGGWVMVKTTYRYPIYTPILKGVLDWGGFLEDGKFPIVRYAIYRIE